MESLTKLAKDPEVKEALKSKTPPGKLANADLLATKIVRTLDVRKTFYRGGEPLHALNGVNFWVKRGDYVSIMGPSGSGKSTLFNMIGGLDKPNQGRVFIDEVDIAALDTVELAWLRCHKVGYIFQSFNLIKVASALDNVMLPMTFAGMQQVDAQQKAAELLKKVGLGDRILHKPVQMSGGQMQRVAIARALANDPAIILADEPTGNLDANTGLQIIDLLREMNEVMGVTVITATHDYKMLSVSDRIAWIRDGQLIRYEERGDVAIEEGHIQAAQKGTNLTVSVGDKSDASAKDDDSVIVSAKGVKRLYKMGEEKVWALNGVDVDIKRGEYLSIMGPSGSGKSTIFNMIGGLDIPTEGSVKIDGRETRDMDQYEAAYLRCSKIGYIFQTFNLIPVMTALENVMLPLTFSGMEDEQAEKKAKAVLDLVGLGHRYDHRPDELSGGQQQRVAIARALANDPVIVLADEPTANLDTKTGEEIINMLEKLKKDLGVTVISATHDHKMLAASDRVIYLVDGKIVRVATKDELNIKIGSIG